MSLKNPENLGNLPRGIQEKKARVNVYEIKDIIEPFDSKSEESSVKEQDSPLSSFRNRWDLDAYSVRSVVRGKRKAETKISKNEDTNETAETSVITETIAQTDKKNREAYKYEYEQEKEREEESSELTGIKPVSLELSNINFQAPSSSSYSSFLSSSSSSSHNWTQHIFDKDNPVSHKNNKLKLQTKSLVLIFLWSFVCLGIFLIFANKDNVQKFFANFPSNIANITNISTASSASAVSIILSEPLVSDYHVYALNAANKIVVSLPDGIAIKSLSLKDQKKGLLKEININDQDKEELIITLNKENLPFKWQISPDMKALTIWLGTK